MFVRFEGSKLSEGMDVPSLVLGVCCVGGNLYDGLATRTEESYGVCVCLILCDLITTTNFSNRPEFGWCATEGDKMC